MEKIVCAATVYDKNVYGCKRFNKDIMISFMFKNEEGVYDFFFDHKLATKLCVELCDRLQDNIEDYIEKGHYNENRRTS